MKPIVIFGTGQFAEIAAFYFTRDAGRDVAAFTADAPKESTLRSTPVLSFEDMQKHYKPGDCDIYVAIGSSAVNRNRRDKCAALKSLGYSLASYISSKAIVWSESIGEHAFILEHNTLQPYSNIGNNVILWSGNHIGHHVTVEDHCFITSHVVVSGGVTIGEGSFLGVNATLRDHITIGKYNVIGAGAIVLKDTADDEVYACKSTPVHPLPSHKLTNI